MLSSLKIRSPYTISLLQIKWNSWWSKISFYLLRFTNQPLILSHDNIRRSNGLVIRVRLFLEFPSSVISIIKPLSKSRVCVSLTESDYDTQCTWYTERAFNHKNTPSQRCANFIDRNLDKCRRKTKKKITSTKNTNKVLQFSQSNRLVQNRAKDLTNWRSFGEEWDWP